MQSLIEAKKRQIDIELQQELNKIDDEYSANNMQSSGPHLSARGLAEIKANERKKGIEAEIKIMHGENKREKEAKIILYKNGRLIYTAKSGNKYEAKFTIGSNPNKLMIFLSQNPGNLFQANEIANKLKTSKETEDRLIRDTIQYLRARLKLTKEDDFFIVKGARFGINSDVEIRL